MESNTDPPEIRSDAAIHGAFWMALLKSCSQAQILLSATVNSDDVQTVNTPTFMNGNSHCHTGLNPEQCHRC